MKNIKTFETWKDNTIDTTLFSSGRAKYNPKIVGDTIRYKSDSINGSYFAEIKKVGNKFICKIFKKTIDGDIIELRRKSKENLKDSHNYVREFINQRLNKKKKRKYKESDKLNSVLDNIFDKNKTYNTEPKPTFKPSFKEFKIPNKSKSIIRRF